MPQVKLGPKFFKNELRVYRDWAEAFHRENIQNSFDAGATRIDITISPSVDGVTRVQHNDNGKGMDRETIENVYFTLGETSKTGPDSVGGFGKARILTSFAQKGYELRTRNLVVIGEGADYTITENDATLGGVELTIDVYDNGRDLKEILLAYLAKSHLSGTAVYVNGERFTAWTYKNQYARDLSFGKLWTNKSKQGGILVRVNGVHMFSPYTSAPFLVILEIDTTQSRTVLQASRDGLIYQYQRELESFLADLNVNRRSALQERRRKSSHFKGGGTFKYRRPEKLSDTIVDLINEAANNPHEYLEQSRPQGRFHSPTSVETEVTISELSFNLFDVKIHDETENNAKRKVMDSYNPMNWDLLGQVGTRFDKRYNEVRSFRAGVEKYKLLVLWKAAIEQSFASLYNVYPDAPDSVAYGVGWAFSDTAEAYHLEEDGIHWLMVDPTKATGNMKFSLADTDSMADLFKLAAHEVVHVVCGDHDENYANVLTDVLGDGFKRKSEVMRHLKESKSAAEAELNRMVAHNAKVAQLA